MNDNTHAHFLSRPLQISEMPSMILDTTFLERDTHRSVRLFVSSRKPNEISLCLPDVDPSLHWRRARRSIHMESMSVLDGLLVDEHRHSLSETTDENDRFS